MSFDKIKFDSYMLRSSLVNHKKIKPKLLKLINKAKAKSQKVKDKYYNDNVTRNDFDYGDDFDRPWVKYFIKDLR